MDNPTKFVLIPLDNRPVSYTLPIQIGQLNKGIEILTPPREFTGDLTHNANIDQILLWLNDTLLKNKIDSIICSLDTIAYGGLIPSRRSPDTEAMIQARINDFKILIEKHKPRLYAFSSIMRISNNNVNEEEKEYWDKYGELIFKYSYLSHKLSETGSAKDQEELSRISREIPPEVLEDYMATRFRNFSINRYYLDWGKKGFLDYLVYSQDDTSEYGFNVQEAKALTHFISKESLSSKVAVQTGADEIPSDLLTRAITEHYKKDIYIYPVFSTENGKNVVSRYEDRTVLKSVQGQIKLCGAKLADNREKADILLLVNTPDNTQNDHCIGIYNESENEQAINFCTEFIRESDKPVILADIKAANGADNILIQNLLSHGININTLYGFSGWNTTGNTLGSAISMGISRFIAEKENSFNIDNFKKLLLIRLADDWAYQTVVRQKIRALTTEADIRLLYEELKPFILNLSEKLELNLEKIELSFPWDRTFEVEINID